MAPNDNVGINVLDIAMNQIMPLSSTPQVSGDDDSVSFGPMPADLMSLNDTVPLQDQLYKQAREFVIRRSNCLEDMIKLFFDDSILQDRLQCRWMSDRGVIEAAVGDGVLRDAISQFWSEFYSQCTMGHVCKVPFIRHDYTAEKWKSVGRIYLFGWREYGYIPNLIAAPFMEEVIYGKSYSSLTEAFLGYVDRDEREILEKAKNNFEIDKVDSYVEVLGEYNCRKLPNKDNFLAILDEIAHKEIIQTPMFVLDCWRQVLTPMAFDSHASLMSRYQSLVPSNKTVKSLLIFPETMSEEETTSSHFLKKFIGGLDDRFLHRFLRFCTGCDLFLGHTIKVNFSQFTGLQRRPIAHTCTYELDIACDYDNYPEFRDEFAKILNTDQWEMDYI